jgi:hypothetical protein
VARIAPLVAGSSVSARTVPTHGTAANPGR